MPSIAQLADDLRAAKQAVAAGQIDARAEVRQIEQQLHNHPSTRAARIATAHRDRQANRGR